MRTSLLCTAVFCALARAQAASAGYYAAIRKAGVPVELHVYNRGGHGFGMTGRTPAFAQLPVSGWPGRFQEWMVDMGFLAR